MSYGNDTFDDGTHANPPHDREDGAPDTALADRVAALEAALETLRARVVALEDDTTDAGPPQCAARTNAGDRCSRTAETGTETCWQHPDSAAESWE